MGPDFKGSPRYIIYQAEPVDLSRSGAGKIAHKAMKRALLPCGTLTLTFLMSTNHGKRVCVLCPCMARRDPSPWLPVDPWVLFSQCMGMQSGVQDVCSSNGHSSSVRAWARFLASLIGAEPNSTPDRPFIMSGPVRTLPQFTRSNPLAKIVFFDQFTSRIPEGQSSYSGLITLELFNYSKSRTDPHLWTQVTK